ncbi:MAG: hypothetical protein EOM67_13485 [Spirochaetia bacterium]|nr:hypothetical protein [Spirochaetia bacterium]
MVYKLVPSRWDIIGENKELMGFIDLDDDTLYTLHLEENDGEEFETLPAAYVRAVEILNETDTT